MRIRHLVHDVRSALRASKIPCELSDADLEAMLTEAIEDVGHCRQHHSLIECALSRAFHVCEEIALARAAGTRRPGVPRPPAGKARASAAKPRRGRKR
jgi:hypothetical protein